MHDIVIRGGSIVDGTGAPASQGDVAIDGDRIVQVGGKAGPGRREVKADGRHRHAGLGRRAHPLRRPGDLGSGAGAVLLARRHDHRCSAIAASASPRSASSTSKALIDLMEGVEDIPGITLTEGLKWDWESFPDYLDALARLPRTIDVAAQIAHHPLRVYVMGERAIAREQATAEDIEAMARLTEEALKAGAIGFTTSRTDQHKTLAGELVPGRYAEHEELLAIGKAMGRAGRGAFGMLSDFEDEAAEFGWMRQVAKDSGRPVWFLLTDRSYDPQRWRRLMDGVRAARADNLPLSAQVAGRPVGPDPGPRHLAQSLRAARGLCRGRQAAAGRDAGAAARPRDAPHDPGAGSLAAAARGAAAAVAPDRDALGPHVPAGRSAGLRAAAGEQHRRHGGARRREPGRSSATTIWSAATAGGWCTSPSPTTCMATSRWCAS